MLGKVTQKKAWNEESLIGNEISKLSSISYSNLSSLIEELNTLDLKASKIIKFLKGSISLQALLDTRTFDNCYTKKSVYKYFVDSYQDILIEKNLCMRNRNYLIKVIVNSLIGTLPKNNLFFVNTDKYDRVLLANVKTIVEQMADEASAPQWVYPVCY